LRTGERFLGSFALAMSQHLLAIDLDGAHRIKSEIQVKDIHALLQNVDCSSPLAIEKATFRVLCHLKKSWEANEAKAIIQGTING